METQCLICDSICVGSFWISSLTTITPEDLKFHPQIQHFQRVSQLHHFSLNIIPAHLFMAAFGPLSPIILTIYVIII